MKIVICMMTYNDSQFIAKAIEALLNQSFRDFILLIGDDCSNDDTYQIILGYQKIDPRITSFRNPKRIAMIQNYRKMFRLAPLDTDFFAWASGHDVYYSNWLQLHIDSLINQPEAILVYSQNDIIDKEGNIIGKDTKFFDTMGLSIADRLNNLEYFGMNYGNMIYGLFRYPLMKNSFQFPPTLLPDVVLLYGLTLHGTFCQIKTFLWARRFEHSRTLTETIRRQQKNLFIKKPIYFVLPYQIVNTIFLIWKTMVCSGFQNSIPRRWGMRLGLTFWNRYALRLEDEYQIVGHFISFIGSLKRKRTISIQNQKIRKFILVNQAQKNKIIILNIRCDYLKQKFQRKIKSLLSENKDLKRELKEASKDFKIDKPASDR